MDPRVAIALALSFGGGGPPASAPPAKSACVCVACPNCPCGNLCKCEGCRCGLLARLPELKGPEIRWRTDYAAALKESKKTGLPLLVDFRITPCIACDKLEASFRDAHVVFEVNENFVPLKLNADGSDKWVADAIGVSSYPTLTVSGPDTSLWWTLAGYRDAETLRSNLEACRLPPGSKSAKLMPTKASTTAVTTVRAPIGHTHTCPQGHTWDHTANPTHTCKTCGATVYRMDQPARMVPETHMAASRVVAHSGGG